MIRPPAWRQAAPTDVELYTPKKDGYAYRDWERPGKPLDEAYEASYIFPMNVQKHPPPPPKTKGRLPEQLVPPTAPSQSKSTRLWSDNCREPGHWFQVPKVLFRKFGELGIKPQHLWLLLALQFDRFRDRPHRYYWDELAAFLEPNEKLRPSARNRVRRWAYELRDLGLLRIKPMRRPTPGDNRGRDYRNERNVFDVGPFEKKIDELQLAWVEEQRQREEQRSKRKKPAA